MEQEIRYCTSADGTTIAYVYDEAGRQPATVCVAHSLVPWEMIRGSGFSNWMNFVGDHRYVRFDRRGIGYSQRNVAEINQEAQFDDLSAVIEHAGLTEFDLVGLGDGCSVAGTYAARHATSLRRLALSTPWSERTKEAKGLIGLIRSNWSLARRALIDVSLGDLPTDERRKRVDILRQTVTPEVAARYVQMASDWRPGSELNSIMAPTGVFVTRSRNDRMDSARAFVSMIPNARLKVIQRGDQRAVRAFLDGEDAPSLQPAPLATPSPASVVTILFTDLVSSTALTQRLGDAKAQELVRAHNSIVREALAAQNGSEIKHTGDGIMASFPTASGALECAVAIQRGVATHADGDLAVHIGLNAGEPVAEESDLFGTSVQLARRICDHASSGQILVSNVVRELSAGKGFLFADIGEVVPKGFEEPVRLYEVRWQEDA